jgi:AraC-like DNA-binding protein
MNQKISIGNREIFDGLQKKGGGQNRGDSFETFLEWQEEIGKGHRREIDVRSGLKLVLEDYQLQEKYVLNMEVEPPLLGFSFCVSGSVRCTAQGVKGEFITESGQTTLSFCSNPKGTIESLSGARIIFISIIMKPSFLRIFLDEQSDQVPDDFRAIVDGNENFYLHEGKTTASTQMAIHQILSCPYQGSIRRMYFESKAIELITHQLAQFEENGCEKIAQLYPDDIERLHEARDILIRSMENAPTLLGLSRQVGLSDTKLKRGFRQVFGTTVFGCLRAHRMERGRQLLAEGKMNVTEVSYEVGYSERANFTRAFTKQFGVSPLFYLREARKGISSTN